MSPTERECTTTWVRDLIYGPLFFINLIYTYVCYLSSCDMIKVWGYFYRSRKNLQLLQAVISIKEDSTYVSSNVERNVEVNLEGIDGNLWLIGNYFTNLIYLKKIKRQFIFASLLCNLTEV